MDGRKALELTDWRTYPVVVRRAPGVGGASRLGLSRGWRWFAALVGPVVGAFCMAVEPAPADPEAGGSVLGAIVFLALVATWIGAASSAMRGRSNAIVWALGAGALSIFLSVSCPISGHHTSIGAWWYAQMAVSTAAFAIAAYGIRALLRSGTQ